MYLFSSIHHVQQLTGEWLEHYNQKRPHEALNNLTPWQFAEKKLNDNSSISAMG